MLKNDESPEAIGKRLRFLRAMAGLKRGELAEKAEVNPASISYWENARLKNLHATSVKKIIDAFLGCGIQCTQTWLLRGNGPEPFFLNKIKSFENSLNISVEKDEIFPSAITMLNEIDLFKSLDRNSVTLKIDNNKMLPFFEINDYVGGVWHEDLKSLLIPIEGLNCFVFYNNIIEIRRVYPSQAPLMYHLIYTAFTPTDNNYFYNANAKVDKIAPVTRLWREKTK